VSTTLLILRHGIAHDLGPEWPEDRLRPLTEEGRRKTREVAIGVGAIGVTPDVIYASPLVRARETAEIVAQELDRRGALRETPLLAPGVDATALLAMLSREAAQAPVIMLVGHEPCLGMLVSRLLTGQSHAVDVPMKKAGLAWVELDRLPPAGRAALRGLYGPSELRAIGRASR